MIKIFLGFLKENLITIILMIAGTGVFLYALWRYTAKDRAESNYVAVNTPVKVTKKADAVIYTKPVEAITMAQFKELFRDEFNFLKKDLDLKAIQSVANVNTETIKNIKTFVRDTLIRDTVKAKVWSYQDKSLSISTIEIDSTRQTKWSHSLGLILVKSKQPRIGIKKLFIWQTRKLIFNAIPSDTNTIITSLNLREIK